MIIGILVPCSCGNIKPREYIEYDGSLGYEAIICKQCGIYHDHFGEHKPDDWSIELIGGVKC